MNYKKKNERIHRGKERSWEERTVKGREKGMATRKKGKEKRLGGN